MKIEHVGIEVNDIYKMELFYRKALGFKLKYRYVSKNTSGLKLVFLASDSIHIELMQNPSKIVKCHGFHIAFQVRNVFLEFKRLKSIGVEGVKEPRETGDGYVLFEIIDPEGNIIEISKKVYDYKKTKIRAVIFDLDGTLIDSEANHLEADNRLLAKYNITLTKEQKQKYVGISTLKMIEEFKKNYNIEESLEELASLCDKYYIEIAKEKTCVFPEMIKFLEMLKKEKIPAVLATGSSSEIIETVLSVTKLKNFFEIAISSDVVKNPKPAPDVFLEASKRLGIPPENCLVMEDSQYGVEAAKRAFMYCAAMPFVTDVMPDSFMMADLLFKNGMPEFSAKKVFKWMKSV